MKILLITIAVAIVVICVVVYVFCIGVMIGSAGVMAILEDALEKEVISDFEIYTEKIESYNPINDGTQKRFEEDINLLLEDESMLKLLIKMIRLAIFRR